MSQSVNLPRSMVLIVLCAAEAVVTLDGMVVTIALPAIQQQLGTAQAELQWVVLAYTLPFGAFLLVSGRLADLYGRRRALVTGLLVFAAASLVAGFSQTTAQLLGARVVQGLGAAVAVPATLALLAAAYRQERERQRAVGVLSFALDVAMVTGLILGGVITAAIGWPWCFFIVVPVGLAAAFLAPAVLEESRDETAPRRLDLLGAALAAGGFGLLAFGFARVEHTGTAGLAFVAAGLVVLVAFVVVERLVPAPMMRFSVLRHRPLTVANLCVVANSGGFGGMMFISTLYLQQVLGFSPMQAGLAFLPLALSAGAGGLAAPRLMDRIGPRLTAGASLVVTGGTFVLLSTAPERDGYVRVLLPAFLVAGFTFAAAFVPLASQAMTGVRAGERGLASGLFQTSTHLGGALVLAVLATAASARGFDTACLVAAGLLVVAAILAVRMGRHPAGTSGNGPVDGESRG